MRKSISVTFFSMVATLLVLGTAVMGFSEWVLFNRYFAQERYEALDSVAEVTQRAADYVVQQAALPGGDELDALSDKLVEGEGYRPQIETLMHQTIKKVSADIESLKMNTAIAQLMTLVNALYDNGGATKAELETVVQLLNPFAPHMTEELWEKLGHSHNEQLAYYPWPQYEEAKCVESTVEIAVQVNGKVKARLKVAADIDAAAAIAAAKADPAVAAALEGKQVVKEIYVKGRLVNLAVKG